MSDRRVLVTGATGFIGRQALAPLAAEGLEVHAVTSRDQTEALAGPTWHRVDLLAPDAAGALVSAVKPTHLLHLAWYAEPGLFWRSAENLRWVEASLRLLRAFAEAGGQRAALAGTCAEYEWERETHCLEGATPLRPATLYGAAKHALHLVAAPYADEVGVSLAWGRIFFVFGPHEDPRRLGGSVARALVRGEPAETSHGEQVRDFLSSVDLGEAFAALVLSGLEGPVNMVSGRPVRIADLIEALAAAAGRPDLVRLGARPANPDEPAVLTGDAHRLHDEVGWHPAGTLAQRAAETIAWWRAAESR